MCEQLWAASCLNQFCLLTGMRPGSVCKLLRRQLVLCELLSGELEICEQRQLRELVPAERVQRVLHGVSAGFIELLPHEFIKRGELHGRMRLLPDGGLAGTLRVLVFCILLTEHWWI